MFSSWDHFKQYHYLTLLLKMLVMVNAFIETLVTTQLYKLHQYFFFLKCLINYMNSFLSKIMPNTQPIQESEAQCWEVILSLSIIILGHWERILVTNHTNSICLHGPYPKTPGCLMSVWLRASGDYREGEVSFDTSRKSLINQA